MNSLFRVNGRPFFSIGGQLSNSSAYNSEEMQRGLRGICALGMNTVAAPVYWECLEPEEGRYDFTQTDTILAEAKKHGLKAVLLWFGTWKNGASHYVPVWMKRDPVRFPYAMTPDGHRTAALSPFGEETKKKDQAAFAQLMAHLRDADPENNVLAVQVENEPGLLGTARDFSEAGRRAFEAPVPEEVLQWAGKDAGEAVSWEKLFGYDAAEIFSAYHISRYVNAVAEAGQAVCRLPMYVNVWTREQGWQLAGLDFPSGGATSLVLDLWKRFAPAIDAFCPDIYFNDFASYDGLCASYHRPDNLLYVPESRADSRNGRHLLTALEKHALSGIHCFAVDEIFDEQGELTDEAAAFKDTITILREMKPLIEKYHGTDRLHAVVQYDGMTNQFIDFGDYLGRVDFLGDISDEPYLHMDVYHFEASESKKTGKGLIIYEGEGRFYLAGRGFKLVLMPKTSPERMASLLNYQKPLAMRNTVYLDVSEGHLDEEGKFHACRRRNGDETDTGLWTAADIGVLRADLLFPFH